MTPARLEEVESAIAEQHRRFYGACRPESVDMAVELLADVKRLREALKRLIASATVVESISLDPRAPGEQSESIEVGARAFTLAREALEETPW